MLDFGKSNSRFCHSHIVPNKNRVATQGDCQTESRVPGKGYSKYLLYAFSCSPGNFVMSM